METTTTTKALLALIEKDKHIISGFASVIADIQNMWNEADDFDWWTAYADYADINIFKYGSDELKCCAYPVVNGQGNYSVWVEVPLRKQDGE